MSFVYSVWPMLWILYNNPPWMCIEHTYIILSMIIHGKKMLKHNMDIYLQPLVNELNELWNNEVVTWYALKNETLIM